MRRQFKRIPVEGEGIHVETVIETRAQVSDLSMNGIGVTAPMRLRPGNPCVVTFGSGDPQITLRGTSVWERFAGWALNHRGQATPFFSTGIRLDAARQDLMTSACGEEGGSARALRVKASDMTVLLSYPESITVRNLSSGGILAESWNPMEVNAEHTAKLFLPDGFDPVRFTGKIVSCIPAKNESEKKYYIGLQFVAMEKSHEDRLNMFILMRSSL